MGVGGGWGGGQKFQSHFLWVNKNWISLWKQKLVSISLAEWSQPVEPAGAREPLLSAPGAMRPFSQLPALHATWTVWPLTFPPPGSSCHGINTNLFHWQHHYSFFCSRMKNKETKQNLSPFIRLVCTQKSVGWGHSHSFKGRMEKIFVCVCVCHLSDCCTHLQCACFKKYGWCSQKDLCITPNDTIYRTVTIVTIYQTVIRTQKSVDCVTTAIPSNARWGRKKIASHQMIPSIRLSLLSPFIRLSYTPRNLLIVWRHSHSFKGKMEKEFCLLFIRLLYTPTMCMLQ